MGNNGSMIKIVFDRQQPVIYYTGETVAGNVELTLQTTMNIFNDIYLTIIGSVGFTTTRTARMQNGQTERIVDHHDIRIYSNRIMLLERESNQSETKSTEKNKKTFQPGHYKYPFSFRLPEDLPPTLHPHDFPFVRYELQIFIERGWLTSNVNYQCPLRIFPRVNILNIPYSQAGMVFNAKRKNITIKGRLQAVGLIGGEETTLWLDIINPKHALIKSIDACLIQHYEIEECRQRSEIGRLSVPGLSNTNEARLKATCPIIIPKSIAPTYHFKTANARTSISVKVDYDLRLEVKVRGLFSDFDLQVPISIGSQKGEYPADSSTTTTSTISLNSGVTVVNAW